MEPNSARRYSRPTIIDVARAAGVSKSLVSLALSGKSGVSDASQQKIFQAAADLGYTSNVWARSLVRGRTRLIGVVTTDIASAYNSDVVIGLEDAAAMDNYEVLLAHGRRDPDHLMRGMQRMLELGVDGLVVISSQVPQTVLDDAARRRPVVVVGRPSAAGDLVDVIHNDDERGGTLAVEHLIDAGHRQIGFVATSSRAAVQARREAYERVMQQAGIDYRWIVSAADQSRKHFPYRMITAFTSACATMIQSLPTALFVAIDRIAVDIMGAAWDASLRVPEDIALVGYNNSRLSASVRPGLTSVNQPRNAMGRLAMQFLTERFEGRTQPRREIIAPELVVRSSSGFKPSSTYQ